MNKKDRKVYKTSNRTMYSSRQKNSVGAMIVKEQRQQLLVITAVIFFQLTLSGNSALIEVEPFTTSPAIAPLGCHRRLYSYKVIQTDENGRKCWDFVNIAACWGRCDSGEISDWKFPYKRSYHPVCVHATRQPIIAELKHCDADTDESVRHYEYLEADSCHCQTCSSMDTSCEGPANNILNEKDSVKVLPFTDDDSLILD